MGLTNLRAICPNCGSKIHTQGRGLGRFTLGTSGALATTGTECPSCGAALSGKVGVDNKAIAAEDAGKSFMRRAKEEAGLVDAAPDNMDQELAKRTAEWKQSRKGRFRRRAGG